MPGPPSKEVKKVTEEATDKARGKETLVLPLRVYYVASVKKPGALEPAPCQVWSAADVGRILEVANATTLRLLDIRLEPAEPPRRIDVPSYADVYYRETGEFALQHQQFDRVVSYGATNGQVRFDERETQVLLLARIYKEDQLVATGKGFALDFTDNKRPFELGGNKVLIGYVKTAERMERSREDAACTITGGMLADCTLLGVTLAHEIGHSLHLRHIEHEGIEVKAPAANLMHEGIDLADPSRGSAGPVSPAGLSIERFQYERARRYGRCRGRFRGVGPKPDDECPRLFEEILLPGLKPAIAPPR